MNNQSTAIIENRDIGPTGRLYYLDWFRVLVLAYPNEAVLPFYILHHSVILLVGAYLVKWDRGVGTKFFVIAAVSMAIIMAVYELMIRRLNILHFLFGMRSKK
jgi:hypothetical protein